MSSNVVNSVPYLRTSRTFPQEIQALTVEIDKSYVDIANAVNSRIIGIYPTNRPALTGSSWYISRNQRQQTLRQVYTFTSSGAIPHGIDIAQIGGFTAIYGTFTDGTNWYPLPYVDATAANNQVQLIVTATSIIITLGVGAPPAISRGTIVLEWLSFA